MVSFLRAFKGLTVMSVTLLRPFRQPVYIAATCVFLAGAGVMNLLWWHGDRRHDIPGLWDYRAAVIGDGLLLPIAAGILVAAIPKLRPAPNELPIAALVAALSSLTGGLVLASWLRDPNPSINWTLPAPHTFNAAGWYHAAFLVAASGFLSGSVMLLLLRSRHERRGSSKNREKVVALLESPWSSVLIGCLAGFAGLVIVDSWSSMTTVASLSSTSAVLFGATITAGLMRWAFGEAVYSAPRNILSGFLLALGISLSSRPLSVDSRIEMAEIAVLGFGSAVLLAQMFWSRREIGHKWPLVSVNCTLLLAGGWYLMKDLTSPSLWGTVLPFAIGVVTMCLVGFELGVISKHARVRRSAKCITLAVSYLLASLLAAHWLLEMERAAVATSLIVVVLARNLEHTLLPAGQKRYDMLVEDEESLGPGPRIEETFWITWITIAGMIVAVIVSWLILMSALGWTDSISGNSPGMYFGDQITWVIVGMVAATAFSVAAISATPPKCENGERLHWNPAPPLQLSSSEICWLIVAATVWATTGWVVMLLTDLTLHGSAIHATAALAIAYWMGHLTFDSIEANAIRIEFMAPNRATRLVAGACGAASGSMTYWLLVSGIWEHNDGISVPAVALTTGMVVLGNSIVSTAGAWVLARSLPTYGGFPKYLSLHHPATNVCHDHILHSCLLVVVVAVILIVHSILTENPVNAVAQLIVVALAPLAAFMALFVPAFGLTLSNYDKHVHRESLRIEVEENSGALRVRGGNLEAARKLNDVRVELIRYRAGRVSQQARWLSPYRYAMAAQELTRRISQAVNNWLAD